MSKVPRILIFDSGLGGLTVLREVRKARPDADYLYVADDEYFPYSDHDEPTLTARILDVMASLIEAHEPDLVVIACNTASTIVLPALRERFKVPFVGTVPAIKPAASLSRSKLVSVLGTEATVMREYTQGLIRDFAGDCDLTLVGSDGLATIAESSLNGVRPDPDAISREVNECFQTMGERKTDVVVLACTHYPLLIEQLKAVAPWEVVWVDPAEAIARRVVELSGKPVTALEGSLRFFYTSGKPPSGPLRAVLDELDGLVTGAV